MFPGHNCDTIRAQLWHHQGTIVTPSGHNCDTIRAQLWHHQGTIVTTSGHLPSDLSRPEGSRGAALRTLKFIYVTFGWERIGAMVCWSRSVAYHIPGLSVWTCRTASPNGPLLSIEGEWQWERCRDEWSWAFRSFPSSDLLGNDEN